MVVVEDYLVPGAPAFGYCHLGPMAHVFLQVLPHLRKLHALIPHFYTVSGAVIPEI